MRALNVKAWLTTAMVFGAGSQTARAGAPMNDDDWRLIETGPAHRLLLNSTQVADLSRLMHVQGRCGGFMDVTDDVPQSYSPVQSPLPKQALNQHAVLQAMLPNISTARLASHVESLSAMHNRFYKSEDGAKAAQWIYDQMVAIAAGRDDIDVELVNHSWTQPSVKATIHGTGGLANEKVILGGHLDSINWERLMPTRWDHAPGADDNASGIAVILETFTTIVESGIRPQRTMEFMGYAAEEIGLRGSNEIAREYRQNGANVVGVMQLDMTGFPAATRKITFIKDNTNPQLTQFTERVMDEYVQEPWQESNCGYACSDHASWDKVGYPAVFPFEAAFKDSNPSIHTARDTSEKIDPAFAAQFAKLATAYMVEGAQTAF
jgi:bacterial leucyl aminopeptidase